MAVDLQRTIEIIFAGTDKIGPTITSVGNGLDNLQNKVGSVTGPMADWTKSLLTAEGALVGVGLAMTGVAVTKAGEFKTNVQEIGTLFNGTSEQVQGLGDEILNYATVSTASIDEINGAVYKAISTGTDYADAVKLVADAEVLATAGRADLADTTDVLTSALNAYGDGVNQAADYSDSLFTAIQTGNTNLPELAQNLGKITGTASAAGVPFDDLVATLSALTITTGNTAQSSTKLRALLNELISPSDELAAALGDTTLAGDGLQAVMQVLQQETGGNAEAMSELFGSTEALQAALALANDNSGAFADALEAQANRADVAAAANEELGRSFESINQNLANNIETTFIGAGDPLLDEYADVVAELSDLFGSISFSLKDGAFDDLYDGIEGGADTITELLGGIADALPEALAGIDYDGLLTAFGDLSDSIGGLFGDLDLTNADDLKVVIQAVVDGVEALTRVTAGAVDGLGPFIRTLADVIDSVNKGDEDIQSLVGSVLGFATGVDALLPSLGSFANLLTTVGGGLALLGGAKQAGLATGSLKGLAAVFTNPATGLLAVFGAAVYAIADFGLEVSNLSDQMEEYRKEDERWANASGLTDNWGDMIIKAKELGADVSHLSDVFKDTYGITIEQAEGFNSVSDAMDASALAAQEAAKADKEAAEAKNLQVLAASEQTLAEFARKEALEAQAQAEEDHKNSILGKVKAYQDMTAEEYNLLDVSERQELIDAKRIAQDEGWLDTLNEKKVLQGELLTQSEEEAKALEKEKQLRKEAADELFRQTQQTLDFQLALEKLASDERLQEMEFNFELDLERLKQDGQTARTIIEGIGDTITSTGETLVGLAGALGEVEGYSALTLRNEIERESDRRDEALELQKEITQAQVEQLEAQTRMMEARAESLENGDAAITIEGSGLEPHLEAFMWQIVEAVQVRVNQEGMDMLLGFEGGATGGGG